jgi:hypothetical protein
MQATSHQVSTHALRRGEVLRIDDGEGAMLHLAEGELWITQTGDPRDVFLAAGEAIVLDRPGLTVVVALQPARLNVVDIAPEARGLVQRSLRWLRHRFGEPAHAGWPVASQGAP